ncbi:NYN domain-containing protein [Tengunoibacter tsumagoiensis]|uniref:NYN domain-containing protein n=1 Tax=Tengunoibacter tsumagoiensis TaxID=2014871 RepID=A0A402A0E3_9CHLR|nr:NYN domain-containing protein [Tengunoibacter tsumagoiensis]GCE12526.1 hypothetical protein KTT_23850 [Tengunoibacter tsumagoiensis]
MHQEKQNAIALLIDGENIPPRFIDWIFFAASRKGRITFACVYGAVSALRRWQPAIEQYLLDTRENQPGKNAADRAMQWDAWLLFAQCQVKQLFFATQDGDFASCIWQLRQSGCQVHALGGLVVSEKLVEACQTYTIIGELKGLKVPTTTQ